MNVKELFNSLCSNCQKESEKKGVIDSYCFPCYKILSRMYQEEIDNINIKKED